MSKLNRNALKKMILKEFKMMGMAPMEGGMIGHSPFPSLKPDHGHDDMEMTVHSVDRHHKGNVSKEDCCKAVLCLIECCDCPETKQLLRSCCEDILASC
jgi:hypothetical protein